MTEERFDPLNTTSGNQMMFLEWLADNYPDFWYKVVGEFNEAEGELE